MFWGVTIGESAVSRQETILNDCYVGSECVLSDPKERRPFMVNESVSPDLLIVRCTVPCRKEILPILIVQVSFTGTVVTIFASRPRCFNNTIPIGVIV